VTSGLSRTRGRRGRENAGSQAVEGEGVGDFPCHDSLEERRGCSLYGKEENERIREDSSSLG